MLISATEAKNRFGYFCAQAKKAPVMVEKGGRVDTVMLSVEQYEALKTGGQPKTLAQRQREFNETYKDWIEAQNAHFDQHGLWCDGLVSWIE